MKKGENLEKLVKMIQETLKDSPNTVIYSNSKMQNRSTRKREIDILIETRINAIPIKIAIECKEYSRPVGVEKIEAFKGKCDRINGISKKVFVSSSGYQADAIEASKDFDIELYNLQDIFPDTIIDWHPFRGLNPRIELISTDISFIGDIDEVRKNIVKNSIELVYFNENKEPAMLSNLIWEYLKKEQQSILENLFLDFLKRKPNAPITKKITVPFEIDLHREYCLGINGKRYFIHKIKCSAKAWFEPVEPRIIATKVYKKIDGDVKAKVISVELSEDAKTDIIVSRDRKISIYYTDKSGNTVKLKKSFKYNPKSHEFTILNINQGQKR